ncbi:MAG: peptidoglycan bridge formation glycyltransferase FemA/FemB family protein [Armatimonadetes bacterium]|nr:peptidoglycan bridge formation glycyltransferase FemA/FemB family protein [Candidatus Hippobium faecium]
MTFREIRPEERDDFNNFTAYYDWGDLLQSYERGDLKAKSGWIPIRIIGEENNRIIATANILKKSLPKVNRCIFYIPRGFTCDTHNPDIVRKLTSFIKSLAKKHKAILIKIDPPIPCEDSISLKNITDNGFIPIQDTGFGGVQPKCVMQLDLEGKSEDDLIASFHQKWRYNIRLAAKKGVTVKTDCTKADLPVFYELLKETCKRDGFLVRGYEYFENMWDLLEPKGYIKMFLTYYEGEPLTGSLCYLWGDKAMYTYGASNNSHRNFMPNHLMQWEMIKWAKSNNCKWYDFRGVSPKKEKDENDRLSGLNRFKEGFNPRFVEYIGEFDLPLDKFWYILWVKLLPKAKSLLKKRAKHG